MRDAETIDASLCTLLFKPLQVMLPRHQIVDLLDLETTEPFALPPILVATIFDVSCPDLCRNGRRRSSAGEGGSKRCLGSPVHR